MRAYNKVQSPAVMVVMVADFSLPAFGGVLTEGADRDQDFFARRDAFDSDPRSVAPEDNILPWRDRKSLSHLVSDIRPL